MYPLVRQPEQPGEVTSGAAARQPERLSGQPARPFLVPLRGFPGRPYVHHEAVKLGIAGMELVVHGVRAEQFPYPSIQGDQTPRGTLNAQRRHLSDPAPRRTADHHHHRPCQLPHHRNVNRLHVDSSACAVSWRASERAAFVPKCRGSGE